MLAFFIGHVARVFSKINTQTRPEIILSLLATDGLQLKFKREVSNGSLYSECPAGTYPDFLAGPSGLLKLPACCSSLSGQEAFSSITTALKQVPAIYPGGRDVDKRRLLILSHYPNAKYSKLSTE